MMEDKLLVYITFLVLLIGGIISIRDSVLKAFHFAMFNNIGAFIQSKEVTVMCFSITMPGIDSLNPFKNKRSSDNDKKFYIDEQPNENQKSTIRFLGELEEVILLAIIALSNKNAYGVSIQSEIFNRTGINTSISSIYTVLGRLESKGLVFSTLGEPTNQKGGKAKRFFEVSDLGIKHLNKSRAVYTAMSKGACFSIDAEKSIA